MMLYFDTLTAWRFEAREEPLGTYVLTGFRDGEKRLELTGTDTTVLVKQCREEAERLEGSGRDPG